MKWAQLPSPMESASQFANVIDRGGWIAQRCGELSKARHRIALGPRLGPHIGVSFAHRHIMPGAGLFLPEIGWIRFPVVGLGRRLCEILRGQENLDIGAGRAAQVAVGDGAGRPVADQSLGESGRSHRDKNGGPDQLTHERTISACPRTIQQFDASLDLRQRPLK